LIPQGRKPVDSALASVSMMSVIYPVLLKLLVNH